MYFIDSKWNTLFFFDLFEIVSQQKPHGQWLSAAFGGPPAHFPNGIGNGFVEAKARPTFDLGGKYVSFFIKIDEDLDRAFCSVKKGLPSVLGLESPVWDGCSQGLCFRRTIRRHFR